MLQKKYLPVFAILLLLVLWLIVKCIKFNLGFYFSDMYSHLQLSNFWLRGELPFHENRYGDNTPLHNYFLNPLIGIFTFFGGAYGLFAVHILLIAVAAIYYYCTTKNHVVLFAFVLGPFAYWLFDNRPYGFHIELLYVPVSLMLTTALLQKNGVAATLSAIALLWMREDGILVIWAIGTLFLLYNHQHPFSPAVIRFTLLCLLLFIAGIWQLWLSGGYHSRIYDTFENAGINASAIGLNLLTQTGWLLIFILPWAVYLVKAGAAGKILRVLFISLPLVITGWASGLYYLPDTYHGLLWQPRMSAVWSVWFAAVILSKRPAWLRSSQITSIFILWVLQFALLILVRKHNLWEMTTAITKEFKVYQNDPYYNAFRLQAKIIPDHTFVAVPYEYFHLFHRHKIVWPDHPENALKQADVVLARPQDTALLQAYSNRFSTTLKDGIYIKKNRN